MKKAIMSLAVIAAMFAAASCACNNNTKNEADPCEGCEQKTECCEQKEVCDSAKCADCDKAAECDKPCCDKAAEECCDKAE